MTKKFLISLLFLIAFIILISASDKVSARTVQYNNKNYIFDEAEFEYTLVFVSATDSKEIVFLTSDTPVVTNNNEYCDNNDKRFSFNSICTYVLRRTDSNGYYAVIKRNEKGVFFKTIGEVIYSNYDIKDAAGNFIFRGTDIPDKFFNFRHGTLDYSINLTGNDNNIVLGEYIAIFKVNSILFIYTTDEHPTYKYNNYKHYLSTKSSTRTYGYDLKTDTVILEDTLTKYSANGLDIPFDKSQLIYSNFVLKDENSNLFFNTAGDYLGEDDMKRNCLR